MSSPSRYAAVGTATWTAPDGTQVPYLLRRFLPQIGQLATLRTYQVRPGDVVEVVAKAKEHLRIKAAVEAASGRGYPEWLEVDPAALKGTYKSLPQRTELPSTINESLVVELYSK